GDYYCTWMHRGKKRAEFFAEYELEPHGADQPTPQVQVPTILAARDTNTEPLNCPHCGNPIQSPWRPPMNNPAYSQRSRFAAQALHETKPTETCPYCDSRQ